MELTCEFLGSLPDVDGETGFRLRSGELLLRASGAMIAATHNFNSAGFHFRAKISSPR
jgi:hypothetical protein